VPPFIERADDNDIVLATPTVGRFHAVVQQVGDNAYAISDQSSTNGTLVNDLKIDTARLSDGDMITLGAKRLRFSNGSTARQKLS
jgi:pSer/pThr/pTyr-binding forkhead associated (FHA) protein